MVDNNSKPGEGIRGALAVAENLVLMPVLRGWYMRWGASEADLDRTLPGDELVPEPRTTYTRVIEIGAPPEAVWKWVVQIGQGRGGFYSYDWLENLVGCEIESADHVIPEYQQIAVGEAVRLGPEGFPEFIVMQVIEGTALILQGGGEGEPATSTWQFYLEPCAEGTTTRLIVRGRLNYDPGLANRLIWSITEPINFVMERRMMQGIKQRAEGC